MPEKKRFLQMIPIAMTAFVSPFLGSALNLSIPNMSDDFSAGAVSIGWVITMFLLFSTAFSIPFGRVADIYGKKPFFLAGSIIMTLGSLGCGFAPSIGILLLFRAFQGFGAAMINATNTALISSIFPPNMRGRMMGISVTLTYLGLSLGPVLGGQLNHYLGWRSIFYLIAAYATIAIITTITILREPPRPADYKPAPLDKPGILLYLLAISFLLYGITEITNTSYGWAILLIGVVFTGLFVKMELRAEHPLLDMTLLTGNRPFVLSNLAALLNYGASYSVSYVLSIYLQNVMGYSSKTAGLLLITAPAMQVLFSSYAGGLSDRISPYKLASGGMAISTAAIIMLIFVNENTSLIFILATLMMVGLGFAFFSSPNTNAIMSSVEPSRFGVASSFTATSRTLGQSGGAAIINAIFGAVIGNVTFSQAGPEALVRSMHIIFAICAVLGLIGVYCSAKRN